MTFQNLFFDLDDTLLDFHAAEHRAVSLTLEHFGVTPTEDKCALYSKLNLEQWKKLEKGEISRAEVKINRFARFFEQTGLAVEPKAAAAFYEARLSEGYYFMPGAEELIHRLYGKRRLFIVTNGTARVQQGRMADAGITRYFSGIFISELLGADKPSKAFFDACFAQIPDFRKSETTLIGDSLTSDICGGKAAGLYTIWYNPRHEALPENSVQPDKIIADLAEIPALCGIQQEENA